MAFYGVAADVKVLTGIKFGDLGLASDVALTTWIEARLTEIKTLIDKDRNRSDWTAQGWIEAINGIANRWCAAQISFVMAHRDSPIVRVDDYVVKSPTDNIPGKGILADLRRFPRRADVEATRNRFVFSMGVVPTFEEDEDEDD